MPMSKSHPMGSLEDITRWLERRVAELWGRGRTDSLGPVIEDVAFNIFRVSQHPPPPDEEPGFYF